MKKDIFILGCARSGKTTLANRISQYQYNIISVDSYVSAFKENFPELNITHHNDYLSDKSKRLSYFIMSYYYKIKQEYPNQKFVIEGWHILPKDIVPLIGRKNCNIVCLGYPNAKEDEMFQLIRENDQENSTTRNLEDAKLRELISSHIEYSKILKEQCLDLGIPFYETNKGREKILENIIDFFKTEKN